MKVIFLDHQGVMHLKKYKLGLMNNLFDKDAVDILNSIVNSDSNIEIVISSDWKLWVPFSEMCEFYIAQGIKKPLCYTEKTEQYDIKIYGKQRAREIKKWLQTNEKLLNITYWVSIDDIDMRNELSNFVWVSNTNKGIKQDGVKEKILEFLR